METQEEKVRGLVALHDWTLAEVIRDPGACSKTLDRPGMKRLLELVRGGEVGRVVVAKLDRLTRSVRDLAELVELFNKRDVALLSVAETLDTGTAAGRMMMNVIATVAQWEREAIGERTRDALQSLKSRGLIAGNAPYGWRSQGKRMPLVEVPGEQEVLRRIGYLRGLPKSFRAIAEALNAEGFCTRRGTPWLPQYVANILKEGR